MWNTFSFWDGIKINTTLKLKKITLKIDDF